ncbi:unnamed protein product [Blepharisma stoltei]|uniref:Uncharacterized protein n=1 Tax=Blepharisma stoltei TaxID=1481888 RepID=A0AAU9K885_9CILI|nr:unnamed protein product [Blepharisma stoltei]
MEKRSYNWLLKLLSSSSTNLNILETILVADSKLSALHFKDNNYGLSVSFQQSQSLLDFFGKVHKEFLWRRQVKNSGSLICYFISKNERRKIYEKDLKDMISGLTTIQTLNYIQPARPSADIYEVKYNFRIEYTQQGYASLLSKEISGKVTRENDPQIFNIVCDFALTILTLVEKREFKRVMILELEFIEDIEKVVWLAYARNIQIAKPEVCLNQKIQSPSDLWTIPLKKQTKYALECDLASYDDSLAVDKIEENRYISKRGHLRNRESNLNIPIKILHPNEFKRTDTPNNNYYSEEVRKEALSKEISPDTPKSERKINQELIQNVRRLEAKKKSALFEELSKYPDLRAKMRKRGLYEDYLAPKVNSKISLQKVKSETHLEDYSTLASNNLVLKIPKLRKKEFFNFKIKTKPNVRRKRSKSKKKNSRLPTVNISPTASELVLNEIKIRSMKKSLTQKIEPDNSQLLRLNSLKVLSLH